MKIIYEDKKEFAEVVIRCSETASLGKCVFCPFFSKCGVSELQERSVMNGEIEEERNGDRSYPPVPVMPGRD